MAFTHLPLRRSTILGVVAYALVYAPAYLFAATNRVAIGQIQLTSATEGVDPAPLGEVFGSVPATWKVGGWLLYNANRASVSLPTAGARNGIMGLTNVDLLASLGGPALILYLLPPIFLIGAGYFVMEWGEIGSSAPWVGGASITIGYFPLMLIGSFVFTASVNRITASPDGITSLAAGLIYPLIFGAIGGIIAAHRRSSDMPTSV